MLNVTPSCFCQTHCSPKDCLYFLFLNFFFLFSSYLRFLILKSLLTFSLDCTSLSLSIVYHKKTSISIDKLVNVTAFLLYNKQIFVQNLKFFFTFGRICDRIVVLGVLYAVQNITCKNS